MVTKEIVRENHTYVKQIINLIFKDMKRKIDIGLIGETAVTNDIRLVNITKPWA